MTSELHDRWLRGLPPFAGLTLAPLDDLPIGVLLRSLAAIVAVLRGDGDAALYCLHDWHDHDGYLTSARPVDWGTVAVWIASPGALTAASPGDFRVALAVFPEGYRLYLRFGVYGDCDLGDSLAGFPDAPYGWFDVSGAEDLIDAVARSLDGLAEVHANPAAEFFARSYGG